MPWWQGRLWAVAILLVFVLLLRAVDALSTNFWLSCAGYVLAFAALVAFLLVTQRRRVT
jgi:hypothetical protein